MGQTQNIIETNYIKYQPKQKKILKFNLIQRRINKLDLLKRFKSSRYNGGTWFSMGSCYGILPSRGRNYK
jgi:hypothetical protein